MIDERYIDLTGVDIQDLMLPDQDQHKDWVDRDGVTIFDLPPYSITQMVIAGRKSNWFYVDTGADGHGIRKFDKAKMVLMQSIKWHQEVLLRQLEIVKEPNHESG